MSIRFITPNQHGVIDFVVAAALIVAPFALGLGTSSPLAIWISVATGVVIVVQSLLTDYRFGLVKLIPFRVHLSMDGAVGLAYALIPTTLGFTGIDAMYYWVNAAGVLAVVSLGLTRQPALLSPAKAVA
jgi:hypothetical protein